MEPVVSTPEKPKNNSRLVILILCLVIVIVGVVAGLILVRQNQQIQKKASVTTGVAKVYITPESKTVSAGQTFSANILLDTAGQYISALTVDLSYSYTGSAPPISANDIQINSVLSTDSLWNFPIKTINTTDGVVQIKIGGLNSSQTGYLTQGEETIATITFEAKAAGTINVTFNSTTTKATGKSSGLDILLIPNSSGSYTVTGSVATATPTAGPNTTPTPTPTATTKWTTATPSSAPIPVSGVSFPTSLGLAVGGIFLLGSFLLVF